MASNTIPRISPKQQHKKPGCQAQERLSPLQTPKPTKPEPNTLRRAPMAVHQSTSKQTVLEVLEDKKSGCYHKGSTNSSLDKILTEDISSSGNGNLVTPSGFPKQRIHEGNPIEVRHLSGPMSLEVMDDVEKKNCEPGGVKGSSTSAKVCDQSSCLTTTSGSTEISDQADFVESGKSSICEASTSSDVSNESTCSGINNSIGKPHKANDPRWEAIQAIRGKDGVLGLSHFRLLWRLGCGDIGTVYLSELSWTKCYFAMKIMDKASLAIRRKLPRAQTEREILQCLDHPFLPTLYTHFESEKFSCLLMEFCPGGDLHTLRQRQPGKYFSEEAAKFYVAEVLLALEYLHMLGIIYRDLKPENVLVREDGHIMLSDFDLSLRSQVSPTLIRSSNSETNSSGRSNPGYCIQPACIEPSCIKPSCVAPTTCFSPRFFSKSKDRRPKSEIGNQVRPLPELVAEPTDARSMSFVGTHEYLAPEIVKGEGHGSAVDWWTFGIFLYELLFGKTPFKGSSNRGTVFNVVGQPLWFPESPVVSFSVKDLIRGLLVKDPQHRLAYRRGATEIKQHPFFEGVNWALIRCTSPPGIPEPVDFERPPMPTASSSSKKASAPAADQKSSDKYLEFNFF